MRAVSSFAQIYICKMPVDMRKGINGLCVLVSLDLGLSLKENSLFVFVNKNRTRMKMLYFDKSGFAIWLKRLEQSKFPWTRSIEGEVAAVTSEDLELLLDGVNFWTRFEKLDFEYVV